jgi:hypothetical protein
MTLLRTEKTVTQPDASQTEQIDEVLAEIDICSGQIHGLIGLQGLRKELNSRAATGAIYMPALVEVVDVLNLHWGALRRMAGHEDHAFPADSQERYLSARTDMERKLRSEVQKAGGLRGLFGFHEKDLYGTATRRAMMTIDKASALDGIVISPHEVHDPFHLPEPSAERSELERLQEIFDAPDISLDEDDDIEMAGP